MGTIHDYKPNIPGKVVYIRPFFRPFFVPLCHNYTLIFVSKAIDFQIIGTNWQKVLYYTYILINEKNIFLHFYT
jgi:hypothetical protein